MVSCPACNVDIDVDEDEIDEGDILSCDECGAELRVLGLNPVELESVGDDEDDEDEDEEYLDEDEESSEEEEEEEEW